MDIKGKNVVQKENSLSKRPKAGTYLVCSGKQGLVQLPSKEQQVRMQDGDSLWKVFSLYKTLVFYPQRNKEPLGFELRSDVILSTLSNDSSGFCTDSKEAVCKERCWAGGWSSHPKERWQWTEQDGNSEDGACGQILDIF